MKLFDYYHYEDYGHEWYFQLLPLYPRFAFIDCVIQWDEFPATELFPCILFGIGPNDLFGFSIRYKWFEIRFNLLQFKPRNLDWYRNPNNPCSPYVTTLTEEDFETFIKVLDEPPKEIEGLKNLMNRPSPFE